MRRQTDRSQKSSFTSRRKSCQSCADAKARCTLQRPLCSRCRAKGTPCQYVTPDSDSTHLSLLSSESGGSHSPDDLPIPMPTVHSGPSPASGAPSDDSNPSQSAESAQIAARWLNSFIVPVGKRVKPLTSRVVNIMLRVLKSYTRILVKDDPTLPPFMHPLQSPAPQPMMANCRSILRMWDNRAPGSESMIMDTARREMQKLIDDRLTYDDLTLLTACQAYLLYSIHFFSPDAESPIVDTGTLISLLDLASAMSSKGLGTAANRTDRHTWGSWIVMEAKRRTLYSVYILENVIDFHQNAPSYIADEIGRLPSPSPKALWDARQADVWEREYECYIAEWPMDLPRVEDLWPHPVESVARERRQRKDHFVESVDEYGMFFYTITSMVHGS
ncbi:hypothetical protein FB45DRAFT_839980 [Roridomyces roridus]|uniref:Zn(2)-C6 fungal-type domain-containing protein n=1 Tax=Roridomyces roridus TaxID=1738132 RepID=A0AAD7FEN5_9AGAR|nr:hypothetical protein FB45DRAFT_839980 [Roridomyces roridus]